MSKEFHLTLASLDVGQLLDGLRSRETSWRNTAIFLREDYFPDEAFVAEDCSEPEEAEAIADHFTRIISSIEKQITEQGGWSASLPK
jgi:hypothetical protein